MSDYKNRQKTYLRLYSEDKTGGSYTSPTFNLTHNIEDISAFQITDFFIRYTDSASQSIKINSIELSNLSTDRMQGSYDSANQTIHEFQTQYSSNTAGNEGGNRQLSVSPIYNSSNGRISKISFDFLNMDGTNAATNFTTLDKWTMLLCFYH
jgi:hypothetical protein